jgi:ATP synthase subunit 6
MVPYSFTVTSHIVVTFSLALMFFIGINFIGISTHGLHLLSLFLPSGAPLIMAPLLVFIEVVSYSFRVVSLSLRLFANMMSGHCLLNLSGILVNDV